ncbi:Bug family tripartite tricarboxylate transporter substrate binding protein [Allokutzneria albata]|uniref:Putative tricarboxylic transport membrane protein n=1 Tax=Allokutzneria albata TaxID=211114 RepID=A0A1H0AWR7_ALLAB|nr:tripartite tricarboxylate transporter substrate-binding protein [Allokutzneria albata]SDN37513.1 putative tricarboxylic transport membrane protein [Allokutzneria albata]
MTRRRQFLAAPLLLTASLIAGCTSSSASGEDSIDGLRIMVPAKPGGGWHQTAQALQDVLQREKLASGVQVFNLEGPGGIAGLNKLVGEKDDDLLMQMGKVMVAGIINNKSEKTLKDTTPIARLTGESLALVVPAGTPYRNLEQFLTAWRGDPRGTVITGGYVADVDHILAGLIADRVGIDPAQLTYLPNAGGGESVARLLSGEAKAGISGISEYAEHIKAGKLRAIAVSGAQRSRLLPEVKTLTEQGMGLTYLNWRGVVARPGLSEQAKQRLVNAVTKMHASPAWKQTLKAKDWDDAFLTGPEFDSYIETEDAAARKVLGEIGLVK